MELHTLAVAAKNVMSSVPDYLLIETAFTIVQWALVGPLMALAFTKARRAPTAPPIASPPQSSALPESE